MPLSCGIHILSNVSFWHIFLHLLLKTEPQLLTINSSCTRVCFLFDKRQSCYNSRYFMACMFGWYIGWLPDLLNLVKKSDIMYLWSNWCRTVKQELHSHVEGSQNQRCETSYSFCITDVVHVLQHESAFWCPTGPQVCVGASTCFKCTGSARQSWKGIPTNSTQSRHLLHFLMHPAWRFHCRRNKLWFWHVQCIIQLIRWAMELQS